MIALLLFVGILFFLWLGRSILIPLLFATFLWYLINALSAYYRKIFPLRINTTNNLFYKIYNIISDILALGTLCIIFYLFITQIHPMMIGLTTKIPEIQDKVSSIFNYINTLLGLTLDTNNTININNLFNNISWSVAGFIPSLGIVFLYMLFMFIEQSTFQRKIIVMFPNKTQYKKMAFILKSIDENMKKYLFMKTLISGTTALLSYLWLYYLNIEYASVWAFIVFITSYIPTIGAIIACALPIIYSAITTNSYQIPLLVAFGMIGLQIIFGNIIEPKLTGKTLNLSPLAILINLVFWGMIWGIAGMFFSVPLLVATFIITAQFDSTRWIAILLSADGKIPDKREDS